MLTNVFNRYFIAVVFLLNQLLGCFVFSAPQLPLQKKSKTYQLALVTYLGNNNVSEMVSTISMSDADEQVTTKLKKLGINIGFDAKKLHPSLRDFIVKTVADEYLRIKKNEIQQLVERVRTTNLSENPDLIRRVLQSELAEISEMLKLLNQYQPSKSEQILKGILLALGFALSGIVLYVLAPGLGAIGFIALPLSYGLGFAASLHAMNTALVAFNSKINVLSNALIMSGKETQATVLIENLNSFKLQVEALKNGINENSNVGFVLP